MNAAEIRTRATEFKFVVDAALGECLRAWARTHLPPDPYGQGHARDEYVTTSLYWDTRDFDVFHQRASFARAKYRVRRYEHAIDVFVERKLRRPRVVIKRRTAVALADLPRLTQPPDGEAWSGRWFHRRVHLRRLAPVCEVSYRRMARGGTGDFSTTRLTLDSDIRASLVSSIRFANDPGRPVLPGRMILELKFHDPFPTVFKRLLEAFSLSPDAVSKYRLAMAHVGGLVKDETSSDLRMSQDRVTTGPWSEKA